jgi:hypothetical protein
MGGLVYCVWEGVGGRGEEIRQEGRGKCVALLYLIRFPYSLNFTAME